MLFYMLFQERSSILISCALPQESVDTLMYLTIDIQSIIKPGARGVYRRRRFLCVTQFLRCSRWSLVIQALHLADTCDVFLPGSLSLRLPVGGWVELAHIQLNSISTSA